MTVFNKNKKEIYKTFGVLALLYAICSTVSISNIYVYLIIPLVIYVALNGWYWYALRLYRGEDNTKTAFKDAFRCGGWLIILEIMKNIITFLISFGVCIVPASVIIIFTHNARLIVGICIVIMGLLSILTIFSELIYYDNRDKTVLSAVFTSISLARKHYIKTFNAALTIAVPFLLNTLLPLVTNMNAVTVIIAEIVCALLYFVLFPVFTFNLIDIYESLVVKHVKVDDSLTAVAQALDK